MIDNSIENAPGIGGKFPKPDNEPGLGGYGAEYQKWAQKLRRPINLPDKLENLEDAAATVAAIDSLYSQIEIPIIIEQSGLSEDQLAAKAAEIVSALLTFQLKRPDLIPLAHARLEYDGAVIQGDAPITNLGTPIEVNVGVMSDSRRNQFLMNFATNQFQTLEIMAVELPDRGVVPVKIYSDPVEVYAPISPFERDFNYPGTKPSSTLKLYHYIKNNGGEVLGKIHPSDLQ